jgi:late competence protein required for DNA uptake (superfamily II DNA/RNA helicase)
VKYLLIPLIITNIIFIFQFIKQIKKNRLNNKLSEAMKIATKTIANNLVVNNRWFAGCQETRNKEYMAKQLKKKLEAEAKIKKIEEETLEALKNI